MSIPWWSPRQAACTVLGTLLELSPMEMITCRCAVGEYDTCFLVDDAMKAYRRVKSAYKAAGVPEKCDLDRFPGVHEFSGRKAFGFFEKWLKR